MFKLKKIVELNFLLISLLFENGRIHFWTFVPMCRHTVLANFGEETKQNLISARDFSPLKIQMMQCIFSENAIKLHFRYLFFHFHQKQ